MVPLMPTSIAQPSASMIVVQTDTPHTVPAVIVFTLESQVSALCVLPNVYNTPHGDKLTHVLDNTQK